MDFSIAVYIRVGHVGVVSYKQQLEDEVPATLNELLLSFIQYLNSYEAKTEVHIKKGVFTMRFRKTLTCLLMAFAMICSTVAVAPLTAHAVTTYKITKTAPSNGTFTVPTSAMVGAVSISNITPSAGYSIGTVSVKRTDNGTAISVSGSGNSRSFTMPAAAVTVSVTFTNGSSTPINKTLDISKITAAQRKQAKTYWCWAAVASMMTYYEGVGKTQNQIVLQIKKSEADVTGTSSEVISALKWASSSKFVNPQSVTINSSNFNKVTDQISKGKPVYIACGSASLNMGHAYLIYGIQNNNVLMIDPWTGTSKTVTTAQLLTDGFPCDAFSGKPKVTIQSAIIY